MAVQYFLKVDIVIQIESGTRAAQAELGVVLLSAIRKNLWRKIRVDESDAIEQNE